MTPFGKAIRLGVVATLVLGSITTSAQGFTTGSVFSRLAGVQIRGNLVCAECSLPEVRKTEPYNHRLLQLAHGQERVVIEVNWVSDTMWWNHLTVPQLRVHGGNRVFEQLTAEKNLFKEVEITGLPYSSQTLRIGKVTIRG